MTPEQIHTFLNLLEKLASKQYTITGASDWPMLAALFGIIVALIGAMWADLRSKFGDEKIENRDEHSRLWKAHSDCQDDCCPRGRVKYHE